MRPSHLTPKSGVLTVCGYVQQGTFTRDARMVYLWKLNADDVYTLCGHFKSLRKYSQFNKVLIIQLSAYNTLNVAVSALPPDHTETTSCCLLLRFAERQQCSA